MKLWKRERNFVRKLNNNRINLIMAIIFLFAGAIIFRLISLQVASYDYYLSLASNQQQFFSLLEPKRGRIFLQDDANNSGSALYPIATNKDFALLYAVPRDVSEPDKIAEQLYIIFREKQVKQEVDKLFEQEDKDRLATELAQASDLSEPAKTIKEAEIKSNLAALLADKTFQELRQVKKEAEIKTRREAIINEYLAILKKENDPYEPLEQKVELEILKNFYLALASSAERILASSDLKIKDNKILYTVVNQEGKEKEKELTISGLGFFIKPYRFYPEGNIGANMLGFVSYASEEQRGSYGLEGFFDQELYGKPGSLNVERDALGKIIISDSKQYNDAQDGSDLILTINRSIQFKACKKLNQAVRRHGADGGSVIVMEPKTGAVLAMCASPDYNPNNYRLAKDINIFNNPAIFSQYEPGSIYKAVTMAVGLDQAKVTPQTTYEDTGKVKIADYVIENSDRLAHGKVNMAAVLEQSLNTGAIFVMRQVGPSVFAKYVKDFGFGEKTGIELEGESKGDIKNLAQDKDNQELYAATASFGQGIAVTPLQMVLAFVAVANNGILMKPYIVKEIIKSDGTKITTQPQQIRRVISEKAATILGGMLVNVVENGHGKKAAVKGYYIGGKTGTAQVPRKVGRGYQPGAHIGSFAGFAPVDDPRFVMLVRIDNPRDVQWAESSAAPLFGEIAEFILNYYQVPKERQ